MWLEWKVSFLGRTARLHWSRLSEWNFTWYNTEFLFILENSPRLPSQKHCHNSYRAWSLYAFAVIGNGINLLSDDWNHMIMLLIWLMTLKSVAISLIAKMAHHKWESCCLIATQFVQINFTALASRPATKLAGVTNKVDCSPKGQMTWSIFDSGMFCCL